MPVTTRSQARAAVVNNPVPSADSDSDSDTDSTLTDLTRSFLDMSLHNDPPSPRPSPAPPAFQDEDDQDERMYEAPVPGAPESRHSSPDRRASTPRNDRPAPAPQQVPNVLPAVDFQQLLAVLAQNQTMLLQMQQQQQQQQQQPQPAANPAGADLATGSGVKVSDPVRYTGTDRGKLESWFFQLNLAFRSSPGKFRTNTLKIAYALSWTSESIQGHFHQLAEAGRDDLLNNWDAFSANMRSTFGLLDLVGDAADAISSMVMPDNQRTFYYALEFNKYARRLQGSYGDLALMRAYYKGLADWVKDDLAHYRKSNTLQELMENVTIVDQRHWE